MLAMTIFSDFESPAQRIGPRGLVFGGHTAWGLAVEGDSFLNLKRRVEIVPLC